MRLKREDGISLQTPHGKGPHLALRGESPGFFELRQQTGVPLDLPRGPQGSSHVDSGKASLHASCEGPLGIPLQSVPGPRSSSGDEAGTSGILFSANMDLEVPLGFPQGSQASSSVESCKSRFLSSWKSSPRLPVELT